MTRFPAVAALGALLLAGCASVPHVEPRVAQLQPSALGLDAASPSIQGNWWTAFGDPQLDRLVDMALAGSPDLAGALARVRAAEAMLDTRRAAQLPQIALDAQTPRQRFSENYILPPPLGGSSFWIPSAQVGLNWDLDLNGHNRAATLQARASAEAVRLDAAAARLTLTSAVAQSYVGLARAERLIGVADGYVRTRQQALDLVHSQLRNNLASQFEIKQAETLLAEAQQARTRAVEQRDVLVHALAALVGRGADFYGQITPPALALDTPPAVPDALPADLLGRRPDLLAGQARIDAAVSGRKVARADFLPNANIQALAGVIALGFGDVFKLSSTQASVGPAIHVPIFEGGRLRAEYRGATAELDQAVAAYDSAVLAAVRDAADAATHVRAADRDLADQARVVQGMRDTARLDQVRVSTGLGSRLDTVASGFRLLEAEQALVDLQATALTRRIQLIAALGGGYSSSASDIQHD